MAEHQLIARDVTPKEALLRIIADTTPNPATASQFREAAAKEREAVTGALAEQRHQIYDLDADSRITLPGTTCPACPPREEKVA